MGVSKNSGTPKWMVYDGKPYEIGWFGGTTIFGNIHIPSLSWGAGWPQLRPWEPSLATVDLLFRPRSQVDSIFQFLPGMLLHKKPGNKTITDTTKGIYIYIHTNSESGCILEKIVKLWILGIWMYFPCVLILIGIWMYFDCCDWYLVRKDIAASSVVRDIIWAIYFKKNLTNIWITAISGRFPY